jgi:small subunit ribosomal protein S16
MVAIRLRRAGSKKRPFFRIVVADSRGACDSSFVEILGHYNPRTKPAIVKVDAERVYTGAAWRPTLRFGEDLLAHIDAGDVQPPVAVPVRPRLLNQQRRRSSGGRGAERVPPRMQAYGGRATNERRS